jgi:hypothetical protein
MVHFPYLKKMISTRTFGIVEKWLKQRAALPPFLTEAYVVTSFDVFPVEYLKLQRIFWRII